MRFILGCKSLYDLKLSSWYEPGVCWKLTLFEGFGPPENKPFSAKPSFAGVWLVFNFLCLEDIFEGCLLVFVDIDYLT